MLTQKKISIIVPCYKDEKNILELLARLNKVMSDVTSNWEVIYINDSSPDNAADVLLEASKEYENVTVLNMSRNFGVMSVFRAGLEHADGDAVVIMDGDLQDPPEVIPKFVEKWNEGNLVVYGVRVSRDERWYRRIGYKLFYHIWKKFSEVDIPLHSGEFALIDKSVAKLIGKFEERDFFLRGIRSWVGFPQCGISYHRPNRHDGESTQSMFSYIGWAFKAITSFSIIPLRFISVLTFLIVLLFMGLLVWKFIVFLMGAGAPQGFFTLVMVILAAASVQLLALAIISEYIVHIIREVKKRPAYIIESKIVNGVIKKINESESE